MVIAQELKLNDALIRAYDYEQQTQEIDGALRRVWRFDLVAVGQEHKDSLNRVLEEQQLTLTIADENARVRKGHYSYSQGGAHEDPSTRYRYDLELIELLEGEEPPDSGWGVLGRVIVDAATASFDLSMQRYEERLRAIEERLGIDNREHVEAYEQRIDEEVEHGWLERRPDCARNLREISRTRKVKELIASLPPEAPTVAAKHEDIGDWRKEPAQ